MLNNRFFARLGLILSIISWLSLVVIDLLLLFSQTTNMRAGISIDLSYAFLDVFIFSLFLFFRYRIGKADNFNFLDMLWRVFVTGLVATILSLLVQGFIIFLEGTKLSTNPLIMSLFYHINIGLVLIFLMSTFIVWKRLILYQKSKVLVRFWNVFEYLLLISVFYNFIQQDMGQTMFNILLALLAIMGLILSANLKWVAYLNFKQKWRGLLLILLSVLYVIYFFFNILRYNPQIQVVGALNNLFILILFGFILAYALFSFLVILFNLPTSSVFEQKLEEILNFQRLSQSIQSGQNEDEVYDILLDSAASTTLASAGWIEYHDGVRKRIITQDITRAQIEILRGKQINKKYYISDLFRDDDQSTTINQTRINIDMDEFNFRAIIAFPLVIQKKKAGYLVLLKDVADGFNKEMMDIVNTFVNQACVSLENVQLLREALENERYKEELKIAEKVQKRLLPHDLVTNGAFHIAAFSEAASEVGGDYYDIFQLSPYRMALIIGDVSGKGTSAAFHMSQMKGIFHSLVALDLSVEDFIFHANSAVSRCLESNSFITITYFLIDTEKRELHFSRAGHCPSLFYCAGDKKARYFETKGMGLGMLRNDTFRKYIEVGNIQYQPGDVLLLYTDGIIEAKNNSGEEYGYDRLAEFMASRGNMPAEDIREALIENIFDFCGEVAIDDDYTALVVKFS